MPNEAMAALIRALLSNVPVWTLILALLLAVLQTRRAWRVDRWAEASLIWIAFWVLGIGGVYGFVAHLAFGPFLAEQIGWPNSTFQNEVAHASLTIGILGFSSVWYRRRDYLLAAMVAYGSWVFCRRCRPHCVSVGGQQQRPVQCRLDSLHQLIDPVARGALALAQSR